VRKLIILVVVWSTGDMARLRHPCHNIGLGATVVVLGQQGRLVIPAEVRAALGLAAGDHLHLHVAGARLTLQRPPDAVEELRALARDIPRSRSFVDELLAERRLAAAAE
jgi:antitoxin PrlF